LDKLRFLLKNLYLSSFRPILWYFFKMASKWRQPY